MNKKFTLSSLRREVKHVIHTPEELSLMEEYRKRALAIGKPEWFTFFKGINVAIYSDGSTGERPFSVLFGKDNERMIQKSKIIFHKTPAAARQRAKRLLLTSSVKTG